MPRLVINISENTNVSGAVKKVFSVLERILFVAAGLCCLDPDTKTDIFGIVVIFVLVAIQILRKKQRKNII